MEPALLEASVEYLAANLRQCDLDEIKAMTGSHPSEAVWSSLILSSHAWLVTDKTGLPAAICGAAPHPLPTVGVVWMVGTNDIQRLGYSIAKATRTYFSLLNEAYPILWNYIDDRNVQSMRWLRWGGFRLIAEREKFGPEERPFHIFARINPSCATR